MFHVDSAMQTQVDVENMMLHIPRWLIFVVNTLYIWCCILAHFSVAHLVLYVSLALGYGWVGFTTMNMKIPDTLASPYVLKVSC